MAQDYVHVYRQLASGEPDQSSGDSGWADSKILLDRW
jgi:hypothetical protein